VQEQSDLLECVLRSGAAQFERAEVLGERVEPLGRPLLKDDAAVRSVSQSQSGNEPEHDRRGQEVLAQGRHGYDSQGCEGQRHRGGRNDAGYGGSHVDGDADEAPDQSQDDSSKDVSDNQADIQREPVDGTVIDGRERDEEGCRTDLEANKSHVEQSFERGLSLRHDEQDAGGGACSHMQQRHDDLHPERQGHLNQRHALRVAAKLVVQRVMGTREVHDHERSERDRER